VGRGSNHRKGRRGDSWTFSSPESDCPAHPVIATAPRITATKTVRPTGKELIVLGSVKDPRAFGNPTRPRTVRTLSRRPLGWAPSASNLRSGNTQQRSSEACANLRHGVVRAFPVRPSRGPDVRDVPPRMLGARRPQAHPNLTGSSGESVGVRFEAMPDVFRSSCGVVGRGPAVAVVDGQLRSAWGGTHPHRLVCSMRKMS
jgi:hypothetical protein